MSVIEPIRFFKQSEFYIHVGSSIQLNRTISKMRTEWGGSVRFMEFQVELRPIRLRFDLIR